MATMQFIEVFETVTCGKEGCDAKFAVPAHVLERWRETHEDWYCPKGHCRVFSGKNEKELLRQQVAQKQAELDRVQTDLRIVRENRDHFERCANAQRGVTTKLKRRIAAGICPCCKRTFQNLAAHMTGQHPDYAKEKATA